MMEQNGVKQMTPQEILDQINGLPEQERTQFLKQLNPGVTIIFCGSNVNGISLQLAPNTDWDKIIDKIPPEALGEFLKAIGDYARHF